MNKDDSNNHTKAITLKHHFQIEGMSAAESLKMIKMIKRIQQEGSITCYAQKNGSKIGVYLEDGTLYHRVKKGTEQEEMLDTILQSEKLLVGEICSHDTIFTNRYFLIKLYYDYISGNHDKRDIARLWIRDSTANMLGISVPKAKYIEYNNKKDKSRATHFIKDAVDVEMEEEHFRKVAKAIDPKQDGSMIKDDNILAIIPQWASQVVYFVDTNDEPLWIAPSFNADILDQVHQNDGIRGRVISYRNNYDGTYHFELIFQEEGTSQISDNPQISNNEENDDSSKPSISEEVFAKFISDNIGCDILHAPNSSWRYVNTDFLGSLHEQYETYMFKKTVRDNPNIKEIIANVVKGKSVNFCLDINMNKREIYSFTYRYKKLFFPDYTLAKCKQEYGKEQFSIFVEDVNPYLSISPPSLMGPGHIVFYTSFCNRKYIEKQLAKGKILTHKK